MFCTLVFIFFITLPTDCFTQNCKTVIKTEEGTVFGGSPTQFIFSTTEDQVLISIQKTGGRAKTTVNFYVNNQMQKNKTIIFQGSNKKMTQQCLLKGIQGKNIRVEIKNRAVGNKFDYRWTAAVDCF